MAKRGGGTRGRATGKPVHAAARARERLQKRIDREVNRALMARLERDAQRIAAHFGLRYRVIEPERANVKNRYGICYDDGTIKIRLRHVRTGRPLKYSSLVATLCHELAHLRYFHHGETFQRYNERILEWARAEGIYRPDPEPGRMPSQQPGLGFGSAAERGGLRPRMRPPRMAGGGSAGGESEVPSAARQVQLGLFEPG